MKTIIGKGLFQLGSKDLIKGAINSMWITLLGGLTEVLAGLGATPMILPDKQNLIHMGVLAALSFVGYLLKNFTTNSNDQWGKKEPDPIIPEKEIVSSVN